MNQAQIRKALHRQLPTFTQRPKTHEKSIYVTFGDLALFIRDAILAQENEEEVAKAIILISQMLEEGNTWDNLITTSAFEIFCDDATVLKAVQGQLSPRGKVLLEAVQQNYFV